MELDLDTGFAQHVAEDLLSYLRFVIPAETLREAIQFVCKADTPVKLHRIPTDDFLFAEIRSGKTACGHAAEVSAGLEQNYFETFACSRNCGHHAASSSTINNEIK